MTVLIAGEAALRNVPERAEQISKKRNLGSRAGSVQIVHEEQRNGTNIRRI